MNLINKNSSNFLHDTCLVKLLLVETRKHFSTMRTARLPTTTSRSLPYSALDLYLTPPPSLWTDSKTINSGEAGGGQGGPQLKFFHFHVVFLGGNGQIMAWRPS